MRLPIDVGTFAEAPKCASISLTFGMLEWMLVSKLWEGEWMNKPNSIQFSGSVNFYGLWEKAWAELSLGKVGVGSISAWLQLHFPTADSNSSYIYIFLEKLCELLRGKKEIHVNLKLGLAIEILIQQSFLCHNVYAL